MPQAWAVMIGTSGQWICAYFPCTWGSERHAGWHVFLLLITASDTFIFRDKLVCVLGGRWGTRHNRNLLCGSFKYKWLSRIYCGCISSFADEKLSRVWIVCGSSERSRDFAFWSWSIKLEMMVWTKTIWLSGSSLLELAEMYWNLRFFFPLSAPNSLREHLPEPEALELICLLLLNQPQGIHLSSTHRAAWQTLTHQSPLEVRF